METPYDKLFSNNRVWAAEKLALDPDYFTHLAQGQTPQYLMISCADSRVPPTSITKTEPGEMFVHRNIANVFVQTDLNAQSVLQYAVEVLRVQHVIVMGHYGCGGVQAAMDHEARGMIDMWLGHIKDVYRMYRQALDQIESDEERYRRMVELNVREQVLNICKSPTMQRAWATEQRLEVHGWVFDIATGLIKNLGISRQIWENYEAVYRLDVPALTY